MVTGADLWGKHTIGVVFSLQFLLKKKKNGRPRLKVD